MSKLGFNTETREISYAEELVKSYGLLSDDESNGDVFICQVSRGKDKKKAVECVDDLRKERLGQQNLFIF